jgi:hypothetical protein
MLRQGYCRPQVRELASGVDALYLSGRCDLPEPLVARLTAARETAREADGPVPFSFGGYDWEMQPHGLGRYHFRIDHPLAVVGLTTRERLPTLRVQTRAEALHSAMGPAGVVRWITSAITNEGLPIIWTVSRLDLHADVQGWNPTGNDRHRFACRAKTLATYEDDGALSGWTFGNRKSKTVNGRIYDKTREIAGNGHDWWHDIWGPKYDPAMPVWRIEFEFYRAILKEMGLSDPESVLAAVDRIWAYAANEWLTYRRPTNHDRTARWPLSAEWEKIQRVTLAGNALPMERIRAGRAAGGLRTSMPGINGYVATFAAWTGHDTIDDACAALPNYLRNFEATSGRTFIDRVTDKRRRNQ